MNSLTALLLLAVLVGCSATQVGTGIQLATIAESDISALLSQLPANDPNLAGYQRWVTIAQTSTVEFAALYANLSQYVAAIQTPTTQPVK